MGLEGSSLRTGQRQLRLSCTQSKSMLTWIDHGIDHRRLIHFGKGVCSKLLRSPLHLSYRLILLSQHMAFCLVCRDPQTWNRGLCWCTLQNHVVHILRKSRYINQEFFWKDLVWQLFDFRATSHQQALPRLGQFFLQFQEGSCIHDQSMICTFAPGNIRQARMYLISTRYYCSYNKCFLSLQGLPNLFSSFHLRCPHHLVAIQCQPLHCICQYGISCLSQGSRHHSIWHFCICK